jgi:hypothetical protein
MNEHWVEIMLGIFCGFFAIYSTHVWGPMPGGRPGYPVPLRVRVILIAFSVLFLGMGLHGFFKN